MFNDISTNAYYWKKEGKYIRCLLCPHVCLLKNGETGICRTRININGELISTAWNNLCAANSDPVEKKPLFHFIPAHRTYSIATKGCNLRCLACQNFHISQYAPDPHPDIVSSPDQIIATAIAEQCRSIAYTYTEPVVFYEYMFSVAKKAHEVNLKNIMISSGYISAKPLRDILPYLDAINIDLKTFDDQSYQKLSGAKLKPVLKNLKIIRDSGKWLEITCLIIPGFNDSESMISKLCLWLIENGFKDTPIHFSRFFPYYKLNHLNPTSTKKIIEICKLASQHGINYVYPGNLSGFNFENTLCHSCNNLIIKRVGYKVIFNKLINGKCPECATEIPGVFN